MTQFKELKNHKTVPPRFKTKNRYTRIKLFNFFLFKKKRLEDLWGENCI